MRGSILTRLLTPALMVGMLAVGPSPAGSAGEPVFRAIALLQRRAPGTNPRVRFEWTPRESAVEYLLLGSWTGADTWTVDRREFRVTGRNATSWDDRQITFEVTLPVGSHSWMLVPVRRPNGTGDSNRSAHIRFDLR